MAIDEKLIGDVRPNGSAVDRLRKRIRPWESALVGVQEKKVEPQGVDVPPSGQNTQGVEYPEGRIRELAGESNPVGALPTGLPTQGVKNPVSNTPPVPQQIVTNPLGSLPGGFSTPRAQHPVGGTENRAYGKETARKAGSPSGSLTQGADHPVGKTPTGPPTQKVNSLEGNSPGLPNASEGSSATPTGRSTQRVNHPEGNFPYGLRELGDIPSGPDTPRVNNPAGETNVPNETIPNAEGLSTQGVNNPEGLPPTGQRAFEPRIPPIVGFDPSPFIPPDKGEIVWRERGIGELRIPHRLYEFAHRVTSTRNELVVFDCLLRFSLGFHRSWCEAGYSFIGAWTGIGDVTNIKKSLKTLIEAGLVVKTKEPDSCSNKGTFYELPVVKSYLEYVAIRKEQMSREAPGSEPVGELPTGHLTPGGATPSGRGQQTYGGVGDLPTKKENLNKNPKKTLSQESSEELDAYMDQIKPASKRESEIHFLGKLLSEYSSQDVMMSLTYVQRFGALGSKEPCHSPLKYLCTAIEQVLPKARENQSFLRNVGNQSSVTKTGTSSEQNESAQARLRDDALSAFEAQLSQTEQDHFLAEVTKENSVKGYAPPMNVLRSMAALKWFENRTRAA